MDFQEPRLVVSDRAEMYIAQFITPKDVMAFREVANTQFPGDSKLFNTYQDDGRGSSLVGNMLMADVLINDGWSLADLPQIYDANKTFDANKVNGQDGGFGLSTRNCYSDGRLVIRAKNEGTEHILAQIGDKRLTEEGRNGVLKTPIAFQLSGIKPKANGPLQGYSFELSPQARFFKAPQYVSGLSGRFSLFDSEGNPIVSDDGAYTIYNNENSVVRVYADGDLVLDARIDDLRSSGEYGRVVKCRAVGTEKNLAERLARQRNANLDEVVNAVKADHSRKLTEIARIRTSVGI